MSVIDTVRQIVEPLLTEKDIELIEVDFLNTSGKYRLVLTVDKFDGGITLAELACVNKEVVRILDENKVINNYYELQVDSPGLERPLKKFKDYERFIGKNVKIVLDDKIEGQNCLKGKLIKAKDGQIEIDSGKKSINIEINNIKRGNLLFDIKEDLR